MTRTIYSLLILFVMTISLLGCSEKEEQSGKKTSVNGTIEKGPFLTGSKVSLYELDENLNQTGKNFRTETVNDKGDFNFLGIELSSQYVELEISGYFYNEITGSHSSSQINLNALTDLSSKGSVNVNILTHLECKRVRNLMKQGSSFSNAKRIAEKELLNVFYITTDFKNPEQISLTDGDENAAMLLAISSILLYGKSESEFSEFISKLSNEFAEKGQITSNLLLNEIELSEANVNALSVMDNIKKYYQTQGEEVVVNNIRKYIDGNGDGVLDEKDETIGDSGGAIPPIVVDKEELFKALVENAYRFTSDYFQQMAVLDATRCKQIAIAGVEITSSNTLIKTVWERAYYVMRGIHTVLELDYTSFTFDVKPYIGSLRLFRSLIYLDMVQHWGNVPLVTRTLNPGDTSIPRNSKKEVLDFVVKEIKEVVSVLPESTSEDELIYSRDLARAVLASAMLEKEVANYQEAASLLKSIVDNGNFNLLGKSPLIYNEHNKEELYSLKLTDFTIFPLFGETLKHEGSLHPIYRFTGVMLNYAQALYRLGNYAEMKTVINKVRVSLNKGELASLPASDACTEIANLWREAIDKDYGYFALLKQLNLAESTLKISEYQTLYPIPRDEIDFNPAMDQNPGY